MEKCDDFYVIRCVWTTDSVSYPCLKKNSALLVRIVDRCETEACGTINLFEDAFNFKGWENPISEHLYQSVNQGATFLFSIIDLKL